MTPPFPLTYKDVSKGLEAAGFTLLDKKSTAHEKWRIVITKNGIKTTRNVTVDKHLSPFDVSLQKLMAEQAGMSLKQFRELCTKDGIKKAKKGKLTWLTGIFN